MRSTPYPKPRERVFALSGFDAPAKRRRERLCASERGQFAWLRLDTCVERTNAPGTEDAAPLLSSAHVSRFLHEALPFAGRGREHVMVVCLDARMFPVGVAGVGTGGRNSLSVDPVLVFQPPVLVGAVAFIFAHNHPSGSLSPSEEDLELTRKLQEGSKLLQVALLDHLILTDNPQHFYSFRDAGLL